MRIVYESPTITFTSPNSPAGWTSGHVRLRHVDAAPAALRAEDATSLGPSAKVASHGTNRDRAAVVIERG